MNSLFKRAWNAAFHPTVRLNPDFPLTGKRLGKAYGVGLLWFTAGTFLPLVLLVIYSFGAFGLAKLGFVRLAYLMLAPIMNATGGKISESTLTVLLISSFVFGFALQMRYFSRVLQGTGHKLLTSVGLGIGSHRQRSWLSTLWSISWRVLVAVVIVQSGQYVLGSLITVPEQPTVTFAKSLSGGNLWAFFVMAAVLAPLFEEVVFRGLLFQALRGTFHQWRQAALNLDAAPRSIFGRLTTRLGATVFATESRADVGAVCLSAAVFSVQHMQFEPLTMLLLFGMGVVLAETFRRTGTLWAGIAVHALNNGLATLLLIWQS